MNGRLSREQQKMRKLKKTRNQIVELGAVVLCFIFTGPNLSAAGLRPNVDVIIEAERHVSPRHIMKNTIFLPLKLTYHIHPTGHDQTITISVPPGASGLDVEHIAPDGTTIGTAIPLEIGWVSRAETVEIRSPTLETHFNIWICPGASFDFSKLGIYRICYFHPRGGLEEDPNGPVFQSNTLTIACVTQERYDQLHMMLSKNPELALASYKFKNPPSSTEFPKYRRTDCSLKKINEFIKEGTKQDEVLLLLGSPDAIYYSTSSEGRRWDEEWFYETSPAGGYYVMFKKGCVVGKGEHGDWNGVTPCGS